MTPDSLLPFHSDPLWGVLLRLTINVVVLYILIFLVYSRFARKKDFMFPLFLMGIILFLICILLKKSEMQMGMALGLFAVFSIMRFRTENLVSKNMAYLFTVTGISVINAMFDFPNPVRGTILINIIVILAVLILEITFKKFSIETEDEGKVKGGRKAKKKEGKTGKDKTYISYRVLYDNLQMLDPDKINDLKKDLSKRTGISIDKVKIRRIDLINNNADLEVFYKSAEKIDLTDHD